MRPVEEAPVALLGDRAGVLEAGDDARHLLLARPADLVACERGIEHHLPQEIQAGREVVAQELGGDNGAVGPRQGVDPAAQRLDRPGQLLGRQLAGAAPERVGGHRRHALLAGRILRRARADDQLELDERQLVILDDDHVEPVVEDRPRHPRQAELVVPVREAGEDEEQRERPHDTPPRRGARLAAGRPGAGTGSRTTIVRWVGTR